jgi:hypothetical protein
MFVLWSLSTSMITEIKQVSESLILYTKDKIVERQDVSFYILWITFWKKEADFNWEN